MVAAPVTEEELDDRIVRIMGQVNELFNRQGSLPLSRREIDDAWKDLELGLVGKIQGFFARFMYHNYKDWLEVASTAPYSHMNAALKGAYADLVLRIAARIKEKGLKNIYSMGPTPSVDKLLLERLVSEGVEVTYHAVDTSGDALNSALEEITHHLTEKFGNNWQRLVRIGSTKPMKFDEVKSNGPSCVIYDSGNMMNDRQFWEQSAGIAGKGGIVVGSAAVNPGIEDMAQYWLPLYDTKEGRAMFRNAATKAFPGLSTRENIGKWDIKFEYVQENWNWEERWGVYQTPMISVQLSVKEPIVTYIKDPETGKRVRLKLDNDKARGRPIVLITSAKLNLAAFLQSVPENFGLKPIGPLEKDRYALREIAYEMDGKRGLAVSAIFDVGNLPVGAVRAYDLQPKLRLSRPS